MSIMHEATGMAPGPSSNIVAAPSSKSLHCHAGSMGDFRPQGKSNPTKHRHMAIRVISSGRILAVRYCTPGQSINAMHVHVRHGLSILPSRKNRPADPVRFRSGFLRDQNRESALVTRQRNDLKEMRRLRSGLRCVPWWGKKAHHNQSRFNDSEFMQPLPKALHLRPMPTSLERIVKASRCLPWKWLPRRSAPRLVLRSMPPVATLVASRANYHRNRPDSGLRAAG